MRLVERETRLREQFASAHSEVPIVAIPAQPGDVHDLTGLRTLGGAFGVLPGGA